MTNAAGVQEVVNTYDPYGRVATQKTPHGRTVEFSYVPGGVTVSADKGGGRANSWISDAQGRLVGVIDADDQRQNMAYDAHGNLVSVTERDGSQTVHMYDERGRRVRTRTVDGTDIVYRWDQYDRLVDAVAGSDALVTYGYEGAQRNPSWVRNSLGGVTNLVWRDGLLMSITDPAGVSLTFTYNAVGDVLTVANAEGVCSRFEYDEAGRAAAILTALGARTSFAYDDAGRIVQRTDPDGSAHRFEYDSASRVVAVIDPLGARTQMRYNAAGELAETIDPLGRSVSRVFDDACNVAAAVLPDGSRWGFEHDHLSRLVATVDPSGSRWVREYDAVGALTATVDPLGNRTSVTADRQQQMLTLADQFGATHLQLDAWGRPVRRQQADGSEELVVYNVAGQPVEIIDATGFMRQLEYDRAGRLVSVTGSDGTVQSYSYDACGRAETYTDATGAVTRLVYDADSRVVARVLPAGERAEYRYDACGRLVWSKEPGRGVARRGYDACGRLVFAADGRYGVRRFVYDVAGQLVVAVNGLGGKTKYSYDDLGRAVQIIDPAGGVTHRTFTALNKVDSVTDPLGRVTRATYDAAGRQLTQTDTMGTVSEWTYDARGRETSLTVNGQVLSRIHRDAKRRTMLFHDYAAGGEPVEHRLEFDAMGRLLSRSRGSSCMRWSYDTAGRLVSRTDAQGATVRYRYDDAGRLLAVKDGQGHEVSYAYDASSRVVEASTADVSSQWVYQDGRVSQHRLLGASGGVLESTQVAYTEWGQVASTATVSADGETVRHTYSYDDASQLRAATVTDTGGRTRERGWEFDASGRLVRSVAPGVRGEFEYDAAGQLLAVEYSSGDAYEFVYDGVGRRVRQRSADGQVREFSYDAAGFLAGVSVADDEGRVLAEHGLLVDATGELAQVDGYDLWWDSRAFRPVLVSVGDHSLGVAPATGWRFARPTVGEDPWAIPGGHQGAAGEGVPFGGFGLSADGLPVVAGLELMGARAYDPVSAGFLSVDPVEAAAGSVWGANPYAYAANNPLNQVDPWGLSPATDVDMQVYAARMQEGFFAVAGEWLSQNWEYALGTVMTAVGFGLISVGITATETVVGTPVGLAFVIAGGSLVSGGTSVLMQKAFLGSVDPLQVALDMIPGGLMVQGVIGGISGGYDYLKSPGPHTVSGFLSAVGVGAALSALPGPKAAAKPALGALGKHLARKERPEGSFSVVDDAFKSGPGVNTPLAKAFDGGAGFSPGKLEYHSAVPALNPQVDLSTLSPYAKGQLGTQLSIDALQQRGGRVLAEEVTFDVVTEQEITRVRLDAVMMEQDGSIWGLESKFGSSASFTKNQKEAYPGFADGEVIPRGQKAKDAIREGLTGVEIDELSDGFPIRVDHWLPEEPPAH
ncbi:MAG: RHS repeat-associated core domain-containing protein [Rothia sp. (in: high G+C Gram-positive bacteria)]|nr:RHS repeat-associated core domain-containing protein [Rothia sp. (in: high G+C Gram-positive bacteria)]